MACGVAFCMVWGLSFIWGHLIIWDPHWAGTPGGLWCLSSFDAGGVVNSISNLLFTALPAHEVGLALGFVGSFGVWFFFGGWGFPWMEWWFFSHVGCDVTCRRLSLRHSLSFRISRFF